MYGSWGRGGVRCKIKPDWLDSGREGEAICYFSKDYRGAMEWVVVYWDDQEDPDCHKASGLLFMQPDEKVWREFR